MIGIGNGTIRAFCGRHRQGTVFGLDSHRAGIVRYHSLHRNPVLVQQGRRQSVSVRISDLERPFIDGFPGNGMVMVADGAAGFPSLICRADSRFFHQKALAFVCNDRVAIGRGNVWSGR